MKIGNKPTLIKIENKVKSKKEKVQIAIYKDNILIEIMKSIRQVTLKYGFIYSTIKGQCEGRIKYPVSEFKFKYFFED